ncbi:MAG: lipopolysaccharide heptosyltransferase II [Acidobacteria bacterium]|nr:lipopolysaccharide heptosyltransferase II [Acidobacteriota bacterium]
MTTMVFSPNWLGDAVMALPAIVDIRRHASTGRLLVAARPAVAGLMSLVSGVDGVVTLAGTGGFAAVRRLGQDIQAIRASGADVAILLPNSMHVAVMAARAGIAERTGYARNLRRVLLSRAVARPPADLHQVDAYRHLVAALGFGNGPREPQLTAPADAVESARRLLAGCGWTGDRRLVGIAPGAAYGGAKRWPPERFASVIVALTQDHGLACALVGGEADSTTAMAIEAELGKINRRSPPGAVINLVGRTDLRQLCGVLALGAAFVSNDSGAMHLAAALGVPVVALFGPTNERATSPVGRRATLVLTVPAWCRPCMLRECPLDHRCLSGITVDRVVRAVKELL